MSKKFPITIDSIEGGLSSTLYQRRRGQFHASLGIDPDATLVNTNANKTSGMLIPSSYKKFSGAALNGDVMWLINCPQNEKTYAITDNDKLISYDVNLSNETDIGTVADTGESGNGDGGAYYNNYIYIATNKDIARYGPLDGTPTIAKS